MLVKQELKHFEKYTEQLLKYVTITVFKGSFKLRNANNMIRSRNFVLKAFICFKGIQHADDMNQTIRWFNAFFL